MDLAFCFCRIYRLHMDDGLTDTARSALETKRRAIVDRIPSGYRPAVHLAVPSLIGLTTLVVALSSLRDTRAVDLLAIPATLLGAFAFEWRAHKRVLHRRAPLLGLLYERHELEHHVVYRYDDMAMRSPSEMWLILMPPYAVVIVLLLDVPFALGAGALFGRDVGLLVCATAMLFFLAYEWLHLAYHLPPESFVGRRALVRRLRELHRRHHDPRLMKRWNFNVTVPVFDWVHGTLWSPARERARAAARVTKARVAAR